MMSKLDNLIVKASQSLFYRGSIEAWSELDGLAVVRPIIDWSTYDCRELTDLMFHIRSIVQVVSCELRMVRPTDGTHRLLCVIDLVVLCEGSLDRPCLPFSSGEIVFEQSPLRDPNVEDPDFEFGQ
jgi:hypothetical protein